MKELKVKWASEHKPTSIPYHYDAPLFSLLGKKENDEYSQVSAWHTCRETFSNEVGRISGGRDFPISSLQRQLQAKSTTRHLSLLVCYTNTKEDIRTESTELWMKESLRIVNIFEQYLGWSRSSLYEVDRRTYPIQKCTIFAFTSSAKWLRCPQLLSLYMLLLRLGRATDYVKDNLCGIDDINRLENVYHPIMHISRTQVQKDVKTFVRIAPELKCILDNATKLFFFRNIRLGYKENPGTFGITRLVNGQADPELKARFERLIKRKVNK
jgi:hypothetical protein